MSMNGLQRAMVGGLGDFDFSFDAGNAFNTGGPFNTGGSSTGHSTRDFVGSLVGAGLQTVQNIFGNRNQPQQYNPPVQTVYDPTLAGGAVTPGSAVSAGIGGAFNNLAATFGVSPATLAVLGIGAAFLLFKQPPRGR